MSWKSKLALQKKKKKKRLDNVHRFNIALMSKKHKNSDLVYTSFDFSKFNIIDEKFSELSDYTK